MHTALKRSTAAPAFPKSRRGITPPYAVDGPVPSPLVTAGFIFACLKAKLLGRENETKIACAKSHRRTLPEVASGCLAPRMRWPPMQSLVTGPKRPNEWIAARMKRSTLDEPDASTMLNGIRLIALRITDHANSILEDLNAARGS